MVTTLYLYTKLWNRSFVNATMTSVRVATNAITLQD